MARGLYASGTLGGYMHQVRLRAPFGRSQGEPERPAATTTQGSHTPLQNFFVLFQIIIIILWELLQYSFF